MSQKKSTHLFLFAALLTIPLLIACEPEPRELNYGSDECAHCRMLITEREFASQLINRQGRIYPFDSIECMAAFELGLSGEDELHSRWVPDFANGGSGWIRVEDAYILESETLRSPMGLHLSAFSSREVADSHAQEFGGAVRNWDEVRDLVGREWGAGGSP